MATPTAPAAPTPCLANLLYPFSAYLFLREELSCTGTVPLSRDFASLTCVCPGRLVLFGGYGSGQWFGDALAFDVATCAWHGLEPPAGEGSSPPLTPPPRSTHGALWVQQGAPSTGRLLVFGGQGHGGRQLDDLWALKGANEADLEGGSREGVVWAKIPLPASGVTWRMGGLVGGSAGECGLVRESKASGC